MAQLVRAPPCHGGGRGFESHPGRFGILAQLGEHLPYKQRVIGSSPIGPIANRHLPAWLNQIYANVAQLAEQLICNQQVIGSSPIVGSTSFIGIMDGFPSGQRGQTVNLLATLSVVRIHLHPFCRSGGTGRRTGLKILRDLYSRTGSIPVCGST